MDHARNIAMHITRQVFNGNMDVDTDSSLGEAVKALRIVESLKSEMQKMQQEVKRCYELADKNAIYGMKQQEAIWNARGQAFRDVIEIIESVLERKEVQDYGRGKMDQNNNRYIQ